MVSADRGDQAGLRRAAYAGDFRFEGLGDLDGEGADPARGADALASAYDVLGFGRAAGRDEVFAQLVQARIIEPASKLDSLRVLEEAGTAGQSSASLKRRLPVYAKDAWRQKISAACAAHAGLGPASLVLYDVSTLYFETDEGDGFRESGFSKERRLERRSPSACAHEALCVRGRWETSLACLSQEVGGS